MKKLTITKTCKSQVNPPINTGTIYETTPGTTGILANGVEILNYKSYDKINYGEIRGIDVLGGGKGL